ncbi:MAG: monomethylamine:corrinoid methyltransferase [Candidatus Bathyarchaeia archaeon]
MIGTGILEVARRAELGEFMIEKDFDVKEVAMKAFELMKEYDIKYNPETPVNLDDGLAKDLYEAGLRMLLETGIYHFNTRRVIKFEESEVKEVLKKMRKSDGILVGDGKDSVKIVPRKPESSLKPTIGGGTLAAPMTKEGYVELCQAYAQEPLFDLFAHYGPVEKIMGVQVRAGSALELYVAMCEISWVREALRRAGRAGMPFVTRLGASLSAAVDDEKTGFRKTDLRVYAPSRGYLKVDDSDLFNLLHYINHGNPILGHGFNIIGGMAGGPESTAIVVTATLIGLMIQGIHIVGTGPQHVKYECHTNRESLWENSIIAQAITSNISVPFYARANVKGRPSTPLHFKEVAAYALMAISSGSSLIFGSRTSATLGIYNYCSPLDARFMAEVALAAPGMKREDENILVKELLLKYENEIALPVEKLSRGKTFNEIYDLETLRPKEESLKLYSEEKKDLENIGVPFYET